MEYTLFTEEMKKDYTILVPTMLPMHFEILISAFKAEGYNCKLLTNSGENLKEYGLKYVHNDTCYPAQVVIGQLIDAIENQGYDKNKIALLITQTGGGCRASNYISLLRKAIYNAGYGHIPVLSLNFSGLDESAVKFTLPLIKKTVPSIIIGDLLMHLKNQCVPYEENSESEKICRKYIDKSCELLNSGYKQKDLTKLYTDIIKDFSAIKRTGKNKIKVGIVGEIFVKFSPLGNNDLESFLASQGTEIYMGGLMDFILYCVYDSIVDYKLYGMGKKTILVYKFVYKYLLSKQLEIINLIKENSDFIPPAYFDDTKELCNGYISHGMKMGEGWLLTCEMLELIHSGVKNIVCAQPFGCLPNHIAGKGMMKILKENFPDVNIVAIDYDASASKVNQENRIKLMLSSALEE